MTDLEDESAIKDLKKEIDAVRDLTKMVQIKKIKV